MSTDGRADREARDLMDQVGWSMSSASYEMVQRLVALGYSKGFMDGLQHALDAEDRIMVGREERGV